MIPLNIFEKGIKHNTLKDFLKLVNVYTDNNLFLLVYINCKYVNISQPHFQKKLKIYL